MLFNLKKRMVQLSLLAMAAVLVVMCVSRVVAQPSDLSEDERKAWSEMEAELKAQQDSGAAEDPQGEPGDNVPDVNQQRPSPADRSAEIARRRAAARERARRRAANLPNGPRAVNSSPAKSEPSAGISVKRGSQQIMQVEANGPELELKEQSASASEAASGTGTIVLQYQDTPIGVIVKALSDKMGKPLVGDYNVEGKVTFVDSHKYTLEEAFDTVNILLAVRNYRLIEEGRFLRLIPLDDIAGSKWPIMQGLSSASDLSDEKLATVLLSLKYLQADVAAELLQDMVSSFGSIVSLPKSKGVLITDRLGNIRRINKLLALIDTEATSEDVQMRMMELKSARARDVAEVIDNLWGINAAPKKTIYDARTKRNITQQPDPKDYVRTNYDDRTNILLLTAEPSKLALAAEMVTRLDVEAGPDAGDMRIFQLKNSSADTMVNIIGQMMGITRAPVRSSRTRGAPTAASADDDVRIVADSENNRLVVSAPQAAMAKIERIITELDSESDDSDSVKVIPLKSADAAQMAAIVTEATSRRDVRGRSVSTLNVTADARSNTLIMTGPVADMNTALKLIEQLDTDSPDDATELRVIRLTSGDASQLASSLLRILSDSTTATPSRNRNRGGYNPFTAGGAGDIKIEADRTSNCLIISAPSEKWPRIEQVLEQLKAASEPAERTTRIIPLKFADADEMSQTLSNILGGVNVPSSRSSSRYGRRTPSFNSLTSNEEGITIVASSQANALLVAASPEDHQRVSDLVAQLDVEETASMEPVTMIQLKVADAASVAQTLEQMLPPVPRGEVSEVQITADQRTNSVLVRAPAAQRKMIEQMIASLDSAEQSTARELRIYHLKHISATEAAELVEQFFSDSAANQLNTRNRSYSRRRNVPSLNTSGSGDSVKVSAAPGDKALVIEAGPEQMTRVISLLDSLDTAQQLTEPLLPRSYTLVNADASQLATSLANLFAEGAASRSSSRSSSRYGNRNVPKLSSSDDNNPQPRFEAETRTNTLLVRATVEQYKIIDEFIDKVEADAQLAEETRIFKLKYARCEDLVEVLKTMLTGQQSDSSRNRNPWAWYGSRNNSNDNKVAVRVAALNAANSIIVQGAPEKIALAATLIEQFDLPDAGAGISIEIVQLENARCETLAEAINASLGEEGSSNNRRNWWYQQSSSDDEKEKVTVTAEPNSNSLIVRGPTPAIADVLEMIRRLDNSGTSNTPQIRTYRLQNNDAEQLAETMKTLFADIIAQSQMAGGSSFNRSSSRRRGSSSASSGRASFTISADYRTNSLVVSTSEAYFTMFEQLLAELEKTEVVDREVHYIQLMNADAYDIADQLDAMFADRKGPDAPVIEVDYFSNSLTIIAKDIDYRRMEPIILKVDSVSPAQVRVISAGSLRAEQLAEQLRKVYPQISDNTLEIVDELPAKGDDVDDSAQVQMPETPAADTDADKTSVPADGIVGQRHPVMIAVDRYSNTLIISGSRQDLDSIEDLIDQLGTGAASAEDEFRWFKIKQADVSSVAATLQELFTTTSVSTRNQQRRANNNGNDNDDKSSREKNAPQQTPNIVRQTKITVVADTRTGHVIVKAKPTEFDLIAQLISQLDQVTTVVTELRTFPLENTTATELVSNIREILGASSSTGVRAAASKNNKNNKLTLPNMLRSQQVSNMLEVSNPDGTSTRVDVSAVTMSANESTNSIIVSAPADAMAVIAGIIHELDQSVGTSAQPVVRLYPVGSDDPAALAEALTSIFAAQSNQRNNRRSSSDNDIIITPDSAGQVIIVSAPQAKHELIANVIDQVRQARGKASAGEVRVYRIDHADASSVADAISQTLASSSSGGGRGRNRQMSSASSLKIAADTSSNSVVVSTTEDNHQRIAELIDQLDSPPGGEYTVRAIQLNSADAAQAAQLLTKLFAASTSSGRRGSSSSSAVVIEGYSESKTLLVRADDETFEKVKALAMQIDASGDTASGVFIVPLERAKAARMAEVVLDLYNQQVKAAGKNTVEPLAVTADERANALILGCSPQQYEKVKSWIERIETMSPNHGTPRIIPIEYADPDEVDEAIRKLFGDGQSSTGGSSSGRGGSRGGRSSAASDTLPFEMTVLSSQRQLLLDAADEDYQAVLELVARLDAAAHDRRADVRVFDLKFADNKKVAEALTQVFKQTAREGRSDDDVTITALANTNAVMVAGSPQRLEEAAALITQLDTENVSPELEFRVYQLRYAKPSNIKDLLEKLLADHQQSSVNEQLTITADDNTRSIIVSARGKIFEQIEKILKAIDIEPEVAVTEVRIFQLKRADASALADVLNDMLRPSEAGQVTDEARVLQEQVKRLRIAADRGDDGFVELDLTRPIKISSDPGEGAASGSNSIIVSSTPENVAALAAIIETMDTVAMAEEATVRIFHLQHADCEVVGELLKEVFEQSSENLSGLESSGTAGNARPTNETGSALVRPINISADLRTNALIVSGPVESIDLAADVIGQLDVDGAAVSLAGRVRVIELKYANAGPIAEMLSELFDKRYESARTDQLKRQAPVILPELRSNSLLVVAGQDDHGVIDELLKTLDIRDSDPAVKLVVMPLKHNDAGVVGPMLKDIFDARLKSMTPSGQDPSPQDNVDIATDSLINGLIISASAENLELINDLIAKVDIEPPTVTGIVRIFPLKNADSQRVAEMLESLVSDGLYKPGMYASSDNAAVTAREKVSIVADPRTNVLVVSASRENFAVIDEIITRLDSSDDYASLSAVRVYVLKRAKAVDLAENLDKFFTDKRAAEEESGYTGRSMEATIVADERTNALLVAGGREVFKEIDSLLKKLDGDRASVMSAPTVISLKKADPASVAETIEALYENQGGMEAANLSVKADERTGALVVSGDAADIEHIRQLVKDLDSDKVTRVTELRVFPLERANAEELAELLTSVLTEKLQAPRENDTQQQALLQFIRHLPDGGQMISRALQEGVLITPDKRSNALIVAAASDSMPLLENLVAAMDSIGSPPAGLKIFRLKHADAEKMADVLKGVFRLEEALTDSRQANYTLTTPTGDSSSTTIGSAADAYLTVTVDLRTNTLLIGGSQSAIAMAERVITELDAQDGHQRITDIYRLRNVRASDVQEALDQWLQAERQLQSDRLGDEGLDAGRHLLEQDVTVVAVNNTSDVGEETKTSNTLLITASPQYMPTVKNMIARLDEPQPQVQIDVLIAEVTIEDGRKLGIDWDLVVDVDNAKRLLKTSTFLGAASQIGNDGSGLNMTVTGGDLEAFLQALSTKGKLEVVARPHLTVIDNQEGSLNSGERVPFVTDTQVTTSGSYSTVGYENVGVLLSVTPRISSDGFVRMVVSPEISSISSSSIQIGGTTSPIFNERQITTTVSVKDGHTVVIGGLIRVQEDETLTKIPLLGDIPYLGRLFTYEDNSVNRTELLIILTPRIINSTEDSDDLTRRETKQISVSPEVIQQFDENAQNGFWNYERQGRPDKNKKAGKADSDPSGDDATKVKKAADTQPAAEQESVMQAEMPSESDEKASAGEAASKAASEKAEQAQTPTDTTKPTGEGPDSTGVFRSGQQGSTDDESPKTKPAPAKEADKPEKVEVSDAA